MNKRTSYLESTFETRSDDNQEMIVSGYFIRFNSPTELWDGFFEEISKSALENYMNRDVRALFNHDTSLVLGRTGNNTLRLSVDDYGLKGEIVINRDDPMAIGVYQRIKRGDISGCSFGFNITSSNWEESSDGTVKETITGLDLFEVSPCTFPAYPQTEISARKQDFDKSKQRLLDMKKQKLKEKYTHE